MEAFENNPQSAAGKPGAPLQEETKLDTNQTDVRSGAQQEDQLDSLNSNANKSSTSGSGAESEVNTGSQPSSNKRWPENKIPTK